MARNHTMKKKRVGGRPPGLSGLRINTGSYVIPTTLGREEIDAIVAELQGIEGRSVGAYEHVAQIAEKLLTKQGAITLEGDVAQVQHAKSFAEAAVAANNVKRAKYDKAENVASIIIGVLERIRDGSMTGGAGFLEGLKGMFGMNTNLATTSNTNVQVEEPVLEIPPMQPNNLTQKPNNLTNKPNNRMQKQPNTSPIVNENIPMVDENISMVEENISINNKSSNIQPMTGGKRRKSKTRKHKKSHKRR